MPVALLRDAPPREDAGRRETAAATAALVPAEAALLGAARSGDRAAIADLFERFAPMVHGILLARVPRADVDDLVQDVFLVVMKGVARLREDLAFGAWLATVTRNRAVDFHRRRLPTDDLSVDLADDVTASGAQRSEAERALATIRGLPEAYRETLVLRLVEGMTGPEIAARVGMTPDSVRVNLHRGMTLLRQRLEERP